jgi:hypothetical protein
MLVESGLDYLLKADTWMLPDGTSIASKQFASREYPRGR